MFSAVQKVGKYQHFNRVDFLCALIVGQEQSGFALNGCGDLQGVRQPDRVACPDKRRGFGELLVHRQDSKSGERLEREFDFVGQGEVLIGKRLCEDLGDRDGRGDGAQRMIFQKTEDWLNEIRVGGNVFDIIDERRGIETDDFMLFDGSSKLKRAAIHRAASRYRRRSWPDCPRFLCRDRAGAPWGSWVLAGG